MTYGEYIETLYSTGFFGKNKLKFAHQLFLAAGPQADITENGVKTWLRGPKNYRTSAYFPDDSMKDAEFIRYIKSRTRDRNAWKDLQKAFSPQKTADPGAKDFRVDLNTADSEVFYWSLLNQFQRIFHLPESERKVGDIAEPMLPSQNQRTNEQVRDLFLENVHHHKVMDLINRRPAILNREDSANLKVFLDRIDIQIPDYNPYDASLCASIQTFINALGIKVLTLDANLNNRFSFEDKTASINMENNEDCDENPNPFGLPELTPELIKSAYNPIGLAEILVEEWGNFRDKMNLLFKDISTWQGKS